MATPRIRNGCLHFGGRKGRKGRKGKKREQRGGLGFLAPIVVSAVGPVATNLLNGIVGKLFLKCIVKGGYIFGRMVNAIAGRDIVPTII